MLFNFDFFDLFGKTKRKTRYEKTREAGPRYPDRVWTTTACSDTRSYPLVYDSYDSSSYSDSSSFSSCDSGGGGGCD